MRVAPWLIALFLPGAGAIAAEPAQQSAPVARAVYRSLTDAEIEKQKAIEARAWELYPRRRDTPLRYLNITDNEVREVQRLVGTHAIRELVNISPVVTGCACEEGADCTEQVYVLGKYQGQTVGLQLSRMRNRWSIGRVQRWFLEYKALLAREDTMDHREFEQAHGRLLLEFPMCSTDAGTATVTADTMSAKTPKGSAAAQPGAGK